MTLTRVLRRLAIPMLFVVTALLAVQTLAFTGVVLDSSTRHPVAGATITTLAGVTHTNEHGQFETAHAARSVAVRAPGYLRTEAKLSDETPVTLTLTPFRPKAVYLSVFGITSATLRNRAVSLADHTVINALVIDVKGDRGLTPYRSAAREAIGAAARVTTRVPQAQDFPALLARLHADCGVQRRPARRRASAVERAHRRRTTLAGSRKPAMDGPVFPRRLAAQS